ncbi:MAG: zf-TFIIB domain-containing protein [Phycisphaerae bacterium]|nr:zf-TFIIB domain-containing protein [Phycisphaerae bacterium]
MSKKTTDPNKVAQALQFLSERPTDKAPADAIEPRPCPVCGQPMLVNTRLGVAFNVCPEHGTWLDRGKLQMLLAQMRGPARPSERRSVLRDASGAKPFAPPPPKGMYV